MRASVRHQLTSYTASSDLRYCIEATAQLRFSRNTVAQPLCQQPDDSTRGDVGGSREPQQVLNPR